MGVVILLSGRGITLLLVTSFVGTLIGVIVFYQLMSQTIEHIPLDVKMRVCMGNSMAFSFVFSMFAEIVTGSKLVGVCSSLVVNVLATYLIAGPSMLLDITEATLSASMGSAMGIMLLGMIGELTVWIIQVLILSVETLLLVIVTRRSKLIHITK